MTTCPQTTRLTMSPYDRDKPSITCRRDLDHKGEHQGVEYVAARPGNPTSDWSWEREDRPAYDRLVTWDAGGARSETLIPDADLAAACMTCRKVAKGERVWGPEAKHLPHVHRWRGCVNCGATYHDKGAPAYDGGHPDVADGWCFHCAIWYSRAVSFAEDGTWAVRVHDDSPAMQTDRLYGWSDMTGAFGGYQVSVTWDDGRTVGPRDSLWDAGAIPAEWSDYFPPNARVTPGEKIARAGHTDRFGRPLTYTAHPEV